MNYQDPPFYPNEAVTGHVVELNGWFAVVKVRGWELPLEKRFISWDVLKTASDALSISERIQVVVHAESAGKQDYQRRHLYPTLFWHGFWLSRLPLLETPRQKYQSRYEEGSIIEVEFMDYINYYTARAKMPDGSIIELLQRDLHPKNVDLAFEQSLYTRQCITMRVRRFDGRSLLAKRLS
jgi:hypothetical protein